MAAEFFDGMNDFRLKPRMLRSLLRDRLPDEKRPFPSPSQLSSVLSCVRTHGLLSECLPNSSDRKLVEGWKSAVDDWVDRLLSLVSSNMPDKCWAGICLLGVTCEACSSERFLASFSIWFQKLLSNIQPPSSTHFVKVASCASLADLFTRLAGFSNLKKDAVSLAGKVIHPVIQLLNEDVAEAVWEGAVDLLCTLLTLFPSSMHRHYDYVETAIVSKIMSAKHNANISKKFARCLALLPKVKGDEHSWSLLMQKILVAVNMLLNDAFQGLEEEGKSSEVMRLLVPPGKDPPPPLGGELLSEACEQGTKRLREMLVPIVSSLMHCCYMMLTNPYHVQVTVPTHLLLSLVRRVLLVDGSLRGSRLPFTTAMHQELLSAELPALHLDSLDLLIAIIKGVRSQLIPHAANVVRLLKEYFRRVTVPKMRIKVYSVMQMLLISMGVGMSLYLAQEIINNAFADLNDYPGGGSLSSGTWSSKLASEALPPSCHKKRKHTSGSPMEQNGGDLEIEALSRKPLTPISVKIAALRALEALLTVGGSLKSEGWRSNVDSLIINVATNACDAGWAHEGKCPILTEDSLGSRADFQLAALEALLASLLSPAHVRPPYLSQGLELFRRGKQETGTKLAAFCAHALLALEVLIHPRALPLVDSPAAKSSVFDEGFNNRHQMPSMPSISRIVPGTMNDLDDDDDDDLYHTWLRNNDEETGVDGNTTNRNAEGNEESLRVPMEVSAVQMDVVATDTRDHMLIEATQDLIHTTDVEIACLVGEQLFEFNKEPNLGSVSVANKDDAMLNNGSDGGKDSGASKTLVSGDFPRTEIEQSESVVVSRSVSNLNVGNNHESQNASNKEKALSYDSDSSSIGSLPDIVDEDPDSD